MARIVILPVDIARTIKHVTIKMENVQMGANLDISRHYVVKVLLLQTNPVVLKFSY